jgi:hypothetical protein
LVAPQQNSNATTVFLIETAAQIIINLAGCFKNSLSELKSVAARDLNILTICPIGNIDLSLH